MSTIRLLVGTKKGAFILTSDGTRKNWTVDGPHFGVAWCVDEPPELPPRMRDVQLLPIDCPVGIVKPGECALIDAGAARTLMCNGRFVLAWSTE